jgi:phosphoserine phosphatase
MTLAVFDLDGTLTQHVGATHVVGDFLDSAQVISYLEAATVPEH